MKATLHYKEGPDEIRLVLTKDEADALRFGLDVNLNTSGGGHRQLRERLYNQLSELLYPAGLERGRE